MISHAILKQLQQKVQQQQQQSCNFVFVCHHFMVLHTINGVNFTITPSIFTALDLKISKYANVFSQLAIDVWNLHNILLASITCSFLICISHSGMRASMLSLVSLYLICCFLGLHWCDTWATSSLATISKYQKFNQAAIKNSWLAVREATREQCICRTSQCWVCLSRISQEGAWSPCICIWIDYNAIEIQPCWASDYVLMLYYAN